MFFPNLRLASAADADAGTCPLLAPLSALRLGSLALHHSRTFHRRSVLVAALEDGARVVPGSHASPRRRRLAALFLPSRTGRLFVGLVLIAFFRAAALPPALSFLSFPQPPRPRGRRLGDGDRVDRDGRRGIDVVRRGRLLRRRFRFRRVFVFVIVVVVVVDLYGVVRGLPGAVTAAAVLSFHVVVTAAAVLFHVVVVAHEILHIARELLLVAHPLGVDSRDFHLGSVLVEPRVHPGAALKARRVLRDRELGG